MSEKARAIGALTRLLLELEPGKERYRGLLGVPGQDSPSVSGRPNYVWFQEDGNPSKARQIFNCKVPSITDLPVIVGQDSNNPGFEQVLDIDIGMLPKWLGRSFVPEHHSTHELGAIDAVGNRVDSDVVYVQKPQFVPLSARAQDTPDMTLYVEEDWYLYGTIRQYWPGGSTKSFSPPVTDGYAAYELVCIDGATNQLIYERGPDFPQAATQDETLIPSAPIGSLPIVAVYLPHSETELTYENIADTRIFLTTLGGSITGMAHRHTDEFDGGYLSSGLSITGDVLLKRISDTETLVKFYNELGELHVKGGISVTGFLQITGSVQNLYSSRMVFDSGSYFDSDVRLGEYSGASTGVTGYGRKLKFSGGPYAIDNTDPLEMYRWDQGVDRSALVVFIGDNATDDERFIIGVTHYPDGTWTPAIEILGAGGFELQERSDPSAPPTDHAIVYVRDNGSSKSQLCVRFASGAVQVIATEP